MKNARASGKTSGADPSHLALLGGVHGPARRHVAPRRALLNRPGGSGTETTTATPQPRVEEVPGGVAEHV